MVAFWGNARPAATSIVFNIPEGTTQEGWGLCLLAISYTLVEIALLKISSYGSISVNSFAIFLIFGQSLVIFRLTFSLSAFSAFTIVTKPQIPPLILHFAFISLSSLTLNILAHFS